MALPEAPDTITHSLIMAEFGHAANTQWKISSDGAAYINFTVGSIIKESDFYGASASSFDPAYAPGNGVEIVTHNGVSSSTSSYGTANNPLGQIPFLIGGGDGNNRTVAFATQYNGGFGPGQIKDLQVQTNASGSTWHTMTGTSPSTNVYNNVQHWWSSDLPTTATQITNVRTRTSNSSGAIAIRIAGPFSLYNHKYPMSGVVTGWTSTNSTGNSTTATLNAGGQIGFVHAYGYSEKNSSTSNVQTMRGLPTAGSELEPYSSTITTQAATNGTASKASYYEDTSTPLFSVAITWAVTGNTLTRRSGALGLAFFPKS